MIDDIMNPLIEQARLSLELQFQRETPYQIKEQLFEAFAQDPSPETAAAITHFLGEQIDQSRVDTIIWECEFRRCVLEYLQQLPALAEDAETLAVIDAALGTEVFMFGAFQGLTVKQ